VESAFAWVGQIIEWLGSWIPRVIICQANEGGVRFRRGKIVKEIKPGVRCYLPALTTIVKDSTARRTWDLPPQKLTTKDGRTVMVSASIVGSICDVKKAFVDSYDIEGETIRDRGRKGIVPCVINRTFNEFLEQMAEEAEKEATRLVRSALYQFGVKVEEVYFTDYVETKVYCMIGGAQQPLPVEAEV